MHGKLYHTLSVTAPALDNYRYEVLEIRHAEGLYPLILTSGDGGFSNTEIKDENELLNALKTVFSSEKIRKVIDALIVQSRGD